MAIEGEDALDSLQVGYLDDEIILGIGLEDNAQSYAIAKAETLLQCMRSCPGLQEDAEQAEFGEWEKDQRLRFDTENLDWLDVRN